jgi:hypothetical protein
MGYDDGVPSKAGVVDCLICHGARWVCEDHPEKPCGDDSNHPDACHCGGAGLPCPVCNRTSGDEWPDFRRDTGASYVRGIDGEAIPDDRLPLIIEALEHLAGYKRSRRCDDRPYLELAEQLKRKPPANEKAETRTARKSG